jgi:hypothetical protein
MGSLTPTYLLDCSESEVGVILPVSLR